MFILASNQPWHRDLADRLAHRANREFRLIDRHEHLTADKLAELGAKTVFLPHWSHIIPPSVYETFECIIFHMTDLPYGRGGSPLQNLIVRGHTSTVISALRCTAQIDAGPIYLKRPLDLSGRAEEIFLRASGIIEEMIVELVEKRPEPEPQFGEPVMFKRRTPQEGNWSNATSLDEVYDYIRMLDAPGYPPAFVEIGPFLLEFSRPRREDDSVVANVCIRRSDLDESNRA